MSRIPSDRRKSSWRAGQKARRDRMREEGKTLLRVWCTADEATQLKEALRQLRQQRMQQRQRRAEFLRRLKARNRR